MKPVPCFDEPRHAQPCNGMPCPALECYAILRLAWQRNVTLLPGLVPSRLASYCRALTSLAWKRLAALRQAQIQTNNIQAMLSPDWQCNVLPGSAKTGYARHRRALPCSVSLLKLAHNESAKLRAPITDANSVAR